MSLDTRNLDEIIAESFEKGITYSEDQIRAIVGAPSREEEDFCMCGERIEKCPDSYSHMTQGY